MKHFCPHILVCTHIDFVSNDPHVVLIKVLPVFLPVESDNEHHDVLIKDRLPLWAGARVSQYYRNHTQNQQKGWKKEYSSA